MGKIESFFAAHIATIATVLGTVFVGLQVAVEIVNGNKANRLDELSLQLQMEAQNLANAQFEIINKERLEEPGKLIFNSAPYFENCDKDLTLIESVIGTLPIEYSSKALEHAKKIRDSNCKAGQPQNIEAPIRSKISIKATSCEPCLNVAPSGYGPDIILNSPPQGERPNGATYKFKAIGGQYELWVEYAALKPRPVQISLNGRLIIPYGLQAATGSWSKPEKMLQTNVYLDEGTNVLELYRNNVFPHVKQIEFIPRN
ncbi:hypothetical protein [Teredinibacter turnerae]|uniref:hypothetical protein n=1 Tax=Teredinibacter turnerae TaxID=2426 RepID=UPI000A9ECE4C|nr:hypothetical protein [Teredinibacter turnerae]